MVGLGGVPQNHRTRTAFFGRFSRNLGTPISGEDITSAMMPFVGHWHGRQRAPNPW